MEYAVSVLAHLPAGALTTGSSAAVVATALTCALGHTRPVADALSALAKEVLTTGPASIRLIRTATMPTLLPIAVRHATERRVLAGNGRVLAGNGRVLTGNGRILTGNDDVLAGNDRVLSGLHARFLAVIACYQAHKK